MRSDDGAALEEFVEGSTRHRVYYEAAEDSLWKPAIESEDHGESYCLERMCLKSYRKKWMNYQETLLLWWMGR